MTQVLICAVDATPCPPESQQWVAVDQAFTPQQLGFTTADVFYVWSWGFGVVVFMWWLGWCIGVAKSVINKT